MFPWLCWLRQLLHNQFSSEIQVALNLKQTRPPLPRPAEKGRRRRPERHENALIRPTQRAGWKLFLNIITAEFNFFLSLVKWLLASEMWILTLYSGQSLWEWKRTVLCGSRSQVSCDFFLSQYNCWILSKKVRIGTWSAVSSITQKASLLTKTVDYV